MKITRRLLTVMAVSVWSMTAVAEPIFDNPTFSDPADEVNILADLQVGDTVYTDRDYTFDSIPEELQGLEWLQTANDAKNNGNTLTFDVLVDAELYLWLDNRVSAPAWLTNDWTETAFSFLVTDESCGGCGLREFTVYSRTVTAGSYATGSQSGGSFYGLAGTATAVPEPGTLALLGLGLIGMGFARRKKA